MATGLSSIPTELIHLILTFCLPKDIASFSRCSRAAFDLVYGTEDQSLWRGLFLNLYDDPRKSIRTLLVDEGPSSAETFNWKDEIQRRTIAEFVAHQSQHVEAMDFVPERRRALETFVSVAEQALPAKPGEDPDDESLNCQWLDRVFRKTKMLNAPALQTETQLHSRLRAYIALTHDHDVLNEEGSDLVARRIQSRCFVYDIRNYRSSNDWGPFLNGNESVDWYHIEHLVNVVLTNLRELPTYRTLTAPPLGLQKTRAFTAPGPYSDTDWAGVEGIWLRYVCFMDYRDLFAFNYSSVADGPRNPAFFSSAQFREATRLIEVKLHLVSPDKLCFHEPSPDHSSHNPHYPTLFFAGTSRGVRGNEAKIEGNVRIGKDGTVRWYFGSLHDGSTLWCSKGVQLGGIASAAGIVGSWSTSMHDQGDPVGPFWLWKPMHYRQSDLMDWT